MGDEEQYFSSKEDFYVLYFIVSVGLIIIGSVMEYIKEGTVSMEQDSFTRYPIKMIGFAMLIVPPILQICPYLLQAL